MVYIQYERDSDTYFKAFLLKQYLQKIKKKKKTLFRYNWRVKKHKIFMENKINGWK